MSKDDFAKQMADIEADHHMQVRHVGAKVEPDPETDPSGRDEEIDAILYKCFLAVHYVFPQTVFTL